MQSLFKRSPFEEPTYENNGEHRSIYILKWLFTKAEKDAVGSPCGIFF